MIERPEEKKEGEPEEKDRNKVYKQTMLELQAMEAKRLKDIEDKKREEEEKKKQEKDKKGGCIIS